MSVLSPPAVSDSLRPYGLWPARLLCLWDSLDKDTGVGCRALLQRIFPTQGSHLSLLCLFHWQVGSHRHTREYSTQVGNSAFFFLAMPHGRWNLSSLTRVWTSAPCTWSMECQGSPNSALWIKEMGVGLENDEEWAEGSWPGGRQGKWGA